MNRILLTVDQATWDVLEQCEPDLLFAAAGYGQVVISRCTFLRLAMHVRKHRTSDSVAMYPMLTGTELSDTEAQDILDDRRRWLP